MVRNTLSEGALRRLLTGGKLGLLWPVTVRITLSEGALRRLLAGFQLLELRGHPSLRGGSAATVSQAARISHSRVVEERSTRPAVRRFAWDRGLGCPPMCTGSGTVTEFHMAAQRVGTM